MLDRIGNRYPAFELKSPELGDRAMSDTERPMLANAPKLIARKCHCGDWAGFGFGKGDRQQSWCWTHYPYKTSARLEAAYLAEAMMQELA